MKKLKNWLLLKFLPAWAKDSVYQENRRLKQEIDRLNAVIRERDAYIDGLEIGIRAQRRVIINTGGQK